MGDAPSAPSPCSPYAGSARVNATITAEKFASAPPVVKQARTDVKPMPGDQRLIQDSLDSWMKFWDANIRNRSKKS